jgi:hypothetical protein
MPRSSSKKSNKDSFPEAVLDLVPKYVLNSTKALITALSNFPLEAPQILEEYARLHPRKDPKAPVKGVIIPSLLLVTLNNEGTGGAVATNANVAYNTIFFPNISLIEVYTSFDMRYNDVITITPTGLELLPEFSDYLDINIYYRGIQGDQPYTLEHTYNGTITETVSAYEFGINLPPIAFGCSQSSLGKKLCDLTSKYEKTPVVRTVPTNWINPNTGGKNRTDFLIRAQTGTKLANALVVNPAGQFFNLNDYYDVTYYPYVGCEGPYYSLQDPAPDSFYFFPLKVDYPINTSARAQYQSIVNLYDLNPLNKPQPVDAYFAFASTPPGRPVDCAYACVKYDVDNGFDNRAATYFTSDPIIALPGSQLIILQYNHKMDPGRCRYSSITVYGGTSDTALQQLLAVTTIPENEDPPTDTLIVTYDVTSPSPAVIIVGERIYQYPAPKYENCQKMTIFLRNAIP